MATAIAIPKGRRGTTDTNFAANGAINIPPSA